MMVAARRRPLVAIPRHVKRVYITWAGASTCLRKGPKIRVIPTSPYVDLIRACNYRYKSTVCEETDFVETWKRTNFGIPNEIKDRQAPCRRGLHAREIDIKADRVPE
jgi:hypothetical protein